MRVSTCDLCDEFPDEVNVAEPLFSDFGARVHFAGRIVTVKCHEDNSRVREIVGEDGGGSLRRALLGDQIAAKAVVNGWEGVLIFGAVRDVEALAGMDLGIKALGAIPLKTDKKGIGERDVPVRFGGVDFRPGHWLCADGNGVVVAPRELTPGG